LIARNRESLRAGRSRKESVADGLSGVGLALAASALTTIAGLAMMVFADFGKYRYSGPVIGLCLAVTLAATLTLTPALIRACGPLIGAGAARRGWSLWRWLANRIVAHPVLVIMATLLAFAPFAAAGLGSSGQVTYDFLSSLDVDSPSRQGAELMRKSFPVGESGPVIVVAHRRQGGLNTRDGGEQIARLNYMLYDVPGVVVVRSLADPLGDTRPGASASFVNRQALEARIARLLDRTAELYLAQSAALAGQVARFELVLQHDPFSREAIAALQDLRRYLERLSASSDPFWQGTQFSFTGTTAGIHDLAQVTRSDNRRIERLVVGAVFLVLLIILRRPLICIYLVLSVLVTYYVTIGATELVFSWMQGGSFQGLDWKVPLFLFVILVAVGQDYNVYLVTRVFEEQRQLGPLPGLRTAIERTGGIITSCGVIMVGTFLSMTAGAWSGTLRRVPGFSWIPETHALTGIVQLGFALALGVLLDTFIVRPILVPAFLALLCPRNSQTVAIGCPTAAAAVDDAPLPLPKKAEKVK
jgi:RND superfamily putative drug exporter